MNLIFGYSAIIISFVLGGIEALGFEDDAGGSEQILSAEQRRIAVALPIEEPTLPPNFPPVDIQFSIGHADGETPLFEEGSPVESAKSQTMQPTTSPTNEYYSEPVNQSSSSPTVSPSMPSNAEHSTENPTPLSSKNSGSNEDDPNNNPTEPLKPGSNWCPTFISGNGDACGVDLPPGASWIQCAYSKVSASNGEITSDLQTCACTDDDPFWRCKSNTSDSDSFGAVNSTASVEPTHEAINSTVEADTQTAPGINSSSEISSSPSDGLTEPNKVHQPNIGPSIDETQSPGLIPNANLLLTVEPTNSPIVSPSLLPTKRPTNTSSAISEKTSVDTSVGVSIGGKMDSTPNDELTSTPTSTQLDEPTMQPFSLSQKLPPGIFEKRTSPPTNLPSVRPSEAPTNLPSVRPTEAPTSSPSVRPTATPTISPSVAPTDAPTDLPSVKPTEAPTNFPSCRNATSVDRRMNIFRHISSLSGDEVLNDPENSASRAGSWIADEDKQKLCPDDPNFTQRYVLALLYFSTSGDGWTKCARNATRQQCPNEKFLSDSHECDWGGITCDSEDRVYKINLGKSALIVSLFLRSLIQEHSYDSFLCFDSR